MECSSSRGLVGVVCSRSNVTSKESRKSLVLLPQPTRQELASTSLLQAAARFIWLPEGIQQKCPGSAAVGFSHNSSLTSASSLSSEDCGQSLSGGNRFRPCPLTVEKHPPEFDLILKVATDFFLRRGDRAQVLTGGRHPARGQAVPIPPGIALASQEAKAQTPNRSAYCFL